LIHNNTLEPGSRPRELRLAQRYALATLWFQPNSGNQWNNKRSWLTDAHECEWYGVTCEEQSSRRAIPYLQQQNGTEVESNPVQALEVPQSRFVTELRLDTNSLAGTIPSDLKLLSSLEIVNLAGNSFQLDQPAQVLGRWNRLRGGWYANSIVERLRG
jgi:hypothetical protein